MEENVQYWPQEKYWPQAKLVLVHEASLSNEDGWAFSESNK